MGEFTLKDFQLRAIAELLKACNNEKNEIILKSCTGSGKTIILTHFIDEYIKEYAGYVFIWFTPGKGNLEEQSKNKMDMYIHNSSTKLLTDVMTDGFAENDVCFINWELVTKKDNNALAEGEFKNLYELVEAAHFEGLKFILIVDEEHLNKTYKANDIINIFKSEKIIRASATPQNYGDAIFIDVPEEDVIAEGLIKKMLYINEDVEAGVNINNQVGYLLDKAIEKHKKLREGYIAVGVNVNPLIIIQIPNNSDALLYRVEEYLSSKGISYENKSLAVWLADKKENLEDIEQNDAEPIAVIIKQAVATGWDCPRAQILVKLRDNMDETFEIQTIGRIRRMPQAIHYENSLLDMCYLYTFDEKFTDGVKLHLGRNASEVKLLYLKEEFRSFKLTKEYKSLAPIGVDAKIALNSLYTSLQRKYKLFKGKAENKKILEAYGYIFDKDIIVKTAQGGIITLSRHNIDELNTVELKETLSSHTHGRDFHKAVGIIGIEAGLPYDKAIVIIRRLFSKDTVETNRILALDTKELYAFVLNNIDKLREEFILAISDYNLQQELKYNRINTIDFYIPKELKFTFDSSLKHTIEYEKNVYNGYLSSAAPRSDTEIHFEKFCNENNSIDWFYKNGESSNEFFSIVFEDNAGKQRTFYPDYILSSKNEIWIIETKGGESKSGQSEDRDEFSPFKFDTLKKYLSKYSLKGGFVRLDRKTYELLINTTEYVEKLSDNKWELLKKVL